MATRRGRGEGGLHWDESRQRWIASATVGYTAAGKRVVRKGSGKTKTEARTKLRDRVREYENGLSAASQGTTVADIVTDWLAYGLTGRSEQTRAKCRYLCEGHVIPALGARKLRELTAQDVDRWLLEKATILSTRTLRDTYACLNRAVHRAMARDKVHRNVVALCGIPTGQAGRPSKSLTFEQAKAVLAAAEGTRLHAYVVLSILLGARTEELRALTWANVDLNGQPDVEPLVPPSVQLWHSVRAGGDTKTKKSRRTLALPTRCVAALRVHDLHQEEERRAADKLWTSSDLVFTSLLGTALDAANVRRAFRTVLTKTDLDASKWTPRELRHSFVSLLSSGGVTLEEIADLCGHSGTAVTEAVYRHELRPVLLSGAAAMDRIFPVRFDID
jgi:integrase